MTTTNAPSLPHGRELRLVGRGTTFVREVDGPADAPVVMLLHGLGASADLNWFPAYEALGRHFRVIAIDHRGHGRGIRSRRRFRLTDCADDAAAAARALGAKRVIACGYSMGGPIAQLMWQRHRPLLEGLVMCATSRNFRGHPLERAMFGVLGGITSVARFTPKSARRMVASRLMPIPADEDDPLAQWAGDEVRRGDPRMILEATREIGRYTSHDWIEQVDVPSAVLLTRDDQLVPPRRQRKLAEAIPRCTIHPVDGDHFVCSIAPERFVPVLVEACLDVHRRAQALR